jgi:ComF family protein
MGRANTVLRGAVQSLVGLIYPAQCVLCDARVEADGALCPKCWRETPFIAGLVCDTCGVPLPGSDPGTPVQCDDCLAIARPWWCGRAALVYRDNARKLILMLKHSDQTQLARPGARWMAAVGGPVLGRDSLLVPVPVHWTRLLARRYNQAALLATELGRIARAEVAMDALVRTKRTPVLEGMSRDARFATLDEAIRAHPQRGARLAGRNVVLIDDVMTSGATLAGAAEAALAAGAAEVSVLVLARVAKDA